MNLLRHPGLDLPVFPADTPILHHPWEFELEVAAGEEEFVRSVSVDVPAGLSLQNALAYTDEELDIAAEISGASVIPHQWGLVLSTKENTDRDHNYGPSGAHLVPDGYLLTAAVEVVQGRALPLLSEELTQAVDEKLFAYGTLAAPTTRYRLKDMHAGQCVGVEEPGSPEPAQTIIVDIEPRLAKRSLWRYIRGRRAA